VLLAAALWGTLGTLYRLGAEEFGLSPVTIVFWRAALAAVALWLALGVMMPLLGKGWRLLRVRRADLPVLITFGLLGVTAFYLLYIYAVVLTGVTVAVVLLYTAPIFVALMAWRWLGEGFGPRKGVALVLTLAGCVLVARAYDVGQLQTNVLGILCGLGSAFTYALYSILGKISLRRGYHIATMSIYIYTIGAAGLLAASFASGFIYAYSQANAQPGADKFGLALAGGPGSLFSMGTNIEAWGLLISLALAQTIGALWAYTAGLRHLEAGVASILATFEPVVAALLAYFVLRERVEWPQFVGGALILAAVLLLQARAVPGRRVAPRSRAAID
jgi:drug/metabolite transporter (DMT)-like permease